jgi:hypothetical protein
MDSLHVRPRGTLLALLEKTEALTQSFDLLFAEMRAARAPAERRAEDLEKIDRQLLASAAGLRKLFDDLDDFQTFSDPVLTRALRRVSDNGRELGKQLRAAVDRARAAHADASPSLEQLAARADTMTSILADMNARIAQSGGGLLIRAQRDSAIIKGLHEAQTQLDSLMAETKRNPLRFWF